MRELIGLGDDNLNSKTGCVTTRPPALLQSTRINQFWVFLLVVTVVFFLSFFLFYVSVSDGQTLKQLLICMRCGLARVNWGHAELPLTWHRQEVGGKKLPLFKPGWLFLFSLSVIHFGRKHKFDFKQKTKTWKEGQTQAGRWFLSPLLLFFNLIGDAAEVAERGQRMVGADSLRWQCPGHPLSAQWGVASRGSLLSRHLDKSKSVFLCHSPEKSLIPTTTPVWAVTGLSRMSQRWSDGCAISQEFASFSLVFRCSSRLPFFSLDLNLIHRSLPPCSWVCHLQPCCLGPETPYKMCSEKQMSNSALIGAAKRQAATNRRTLSFWGWHLAKVPVISLR